MSAADSSKTASEKPEAPGLSTGNGLLRRKPTVGPSNGPLEREADRSADQVLAKPAHRETTGRIQGQPAESVDAAVSADQTLAGAGRPLEPALRQDMEQRFGHDFSRVRVHSDAAAEQSAQGINADAYTVGQNIVFGGNQYQPENSAGRRLIAHELAHVLQQRSGTPQAAGIELQMQPAQKKKAPPPVKEPTTPAGWSAAVDNAVRTMFGLGKKDLSSSRTSLVSSNEFAKRFPAAQLEEQLMNIFLAGEGSSGAILAFNNLSFPHGGPTSSNISMLRDFIKEGIKKDKFEGRVGELEVPKGEHFPPFTMTPRELVAESIAGVTDIAPDIPKRTIAIQKDRATVPVLAHETCHFYVDNRYRDMALARPDATEYLYLRGARIGQILLEGFAEYFSRKVIKANGVFGPSSERAYQPEVEVVEEIVGVIGGVDMAEKAYFHGDKKAISLISDAIDTLKTRAPIRVISIPPPIIR